MLSDIRKMLTDTVEHYLDPKKTIHGDFLGGDSTSHRARVVMFDGVATGPASKLPIADAKAILWLVDHLRPIEVGQFFLIHANDNLRVTRVERRQDSSGTLHKVYVS